MTENSLTKTSFLESPPGDTTAAADELAELEAAEREAWDATEPVGGRRPRGIGIGALAAELRVAVMRTSRRLRSETVKGGLSSGKYSVLVGLLDGPRTVGQLAHREQIQAPSMTRIINDLVEAGYVARSENPDDKRQVLVSLTEEGTAARLRVRSKRTAWLAQRVAALTPEQRTTLHEAALLLQEMSK